MALGIRILGRLSVGIIVEETSPLLLLPRDTYVFVASRMVGCSRRCDPLDLGCLPLPIIFDLNCGQDFTPIFMGQVTIVLLIIPKLVLHG